MVSKQRIVDCVQRVYVFRASRARGVRLNLAVVRAARSAVMRWRRVEIELDSWGMFLWRKEAFVVGYRSRVRGSACLVR